MRKKTGRVALCGLLAALALALSLLEGLLPPVPGMPPGAKLGLSNIVTMYAAGSLGLPTALFLTLIKSGFALVGRGGMAGLMSLSGGLVSTVCVWFLLAKTGAGLAAVGVSGALAHNGGQLFVAWWVTKAAVLFYLPFMVVFGVLTGILTGVVLKLTLPPLEKASSFFLERKSQAPPPGPCERR